MHAHLFVGGEWQTAGHADLLGSSCACAPIAANKKVAIAKASATVKDSFSDEKMEPLDQ